MRDADYIIVGQGIAGLCLSYELLQRGKKCLVIDQRVENSSSRVAAGIINPVTGRSFTRTWLVDELMPRAEQFYKEMEHLLGIEILVHNNVVRTISSIREENNWMNRVGQEGYENYMSNLFTPEDIVKITKTRQAYGEVKGAMQVNLSLLIDNYLDWLDSQGYLLEERFDHSQLEHLEDSIQYKHLSAKAVIFCEGVKVLDNPYFSSLRYRPSKGEVLFVRIAEGSDRNFKDKIFLTPLGDKLYWVGAGYIKDYESDKPTKEGRQILIEKLEAILDVPYEIVDHKAAIRPTTATRKPLLGAHPEFPHYHLFNGMGTKGSSLAPYFAKVYADFLLEGEDLPGEVKLVWD